MRGLVEVVKNAMETENSGDFSADPDVAAAGLPGGKL